MSDKKDFLTALKAFKDKVKATDISPIEGDIIMTYDHETKVITAIKEGGVATKDGGTGSGSGEFPA